MEEKILVTGGAGFIGSHLCESLLSDGRGVLAIDDLSTGSRGNIRQFADHPAFEFIEGSIMDRELIERAVAGCSAVFHLAAAVGVKKIIENPIASLITNVRGTDIILEAAARNGRKIFLASSSEVYGKNTQKYLEEECDCLYGPTSKWRWSYAFGKGIDEFLGMGYFRARQTPVVAGRFFNVIGPRQTGRYGMVAPRFITRALRGEPLVIYDDGSQVRTFVYVRDAVEAAKRLVFHCPRAFGQVFNIGSDQSVSINDLAARVRKLTGSASPIVHASYEEVYGPGFEDIKIRIPSIEKLKEYTGFSPETPLDGMLEEIIRSLE